MAERTTTLQRLEGPRPNLFTSTREAVADLLKSSNALSNSAGRLGSPPPASVSEAKKILDPRSFDKRRASLKG